MLRLSWVSLVCIALLAGCGAPPPTQAQKPPAPSPSSQEKEKPAARPVLPAIAADSARAIQNPKSEIRNPTSWATRTEVLWDKKTKDRYDPDYPAGTIKRTAGMGVSGWPALTHQDFVIPAGAKFEKRWDYTATTLPDGTTLVGNSLGCAGGNRNYEPWSFLHVNGRGPGAKKTEDLLKPAICVAANTCQGEGWASAELMFERPLTADCTVRLAVRIKRVAGDPLVYMLVSCDPQGGTLEGLSLSGYPNTTHPVFYGLVPQYPTGAPFLERQRWIWLAGRDWNMHDNKEKHETEIAAADPGGVFWYNRENSETGGMVTVFLPEEATKAGAAGTYGVGVNLGMRGATMRLALDTWTDWRGWEPAREQFVKELPERVKKLREMSFVWPIRDALSPAMRRQVQALLAAEFLPQEGRGRLQKLMLEYDDAAAELRKEPPQPTLARFAKERAVLGLAGKIEDAVKPLLKQWVEKGG